MAAGGGHDCEYVRRLLWREAVNVMGGGQRAPREAVKIVVPLARTHICGSARVVGSITDPVGTVTSGSVRLVSLVILYPYE